MALETARKYARECAPGSGLSPGHFEGAKAGVFETSRETLQALSPSPIPFRTDSGSTPAFPAHALTTMKLRA